MEMGETDTYGVMNDEGEARVAVFCYSRQDRLANCDSEMTAFRIRTKLVLMVVDRKYLGERVPTKS
jgi:GT2 family glycosyltransferase